METKKITEEIRKKLNAPLPEEAISPHPTKKFLNSIKAIYVVERLNDVFGVGNWKFYSEEVSTQKSEDGKKTMVVCSATIKIPEYGIELHAFGGNDNPDLGDAYKGASTDALTKMGSYLEIGIEVFKGKVKPKGTKKKEYVVHSETRFAEVKSADEQINPNDLPF